MKKRITTVVLLCGAIAMSGCQGKVDEGVTRLMAQDDNATVAQGQSVVIDVLANDTFTPEPDEQNITQDIGNILNPSLLQKGSAVLNSDHTKIIYTADHGTYGNETFSYNSRVSGVRPSGSFTLQKQARVTVHITEVPNKPPVADAQEVELKCDMNNEVSIDIELVGRDPEDEPLEYKIVTQPSYGTVTEPIGNQVTYTTQKCESIDRDRFTFKVSDGVQHSEEANVTITIVH